MRLLGFIEVFFKRVYGGFIYIYIYIFGCRWWPNANRPCNFGFPFLDPGQGWFQLLRWWLNMSLIIDGLAHKKGDNKW